MRNQKAKPIDVCAQLWDEQPSAIKFGLLGLGLAKRGPDGRMRVDDEALVRRFAEVVRT
ncbi:MAG TPA: hypothetical protein VIY73_18810 [Polyangiaceae bacterium]